MSNTHGITHACTCNTHALNKGSVSHAHTHVQHTLHRPLSTQPLHTHIAAAEGLPPLYPLTPRSPKAFRTYDYTRTPTTKPFFTHPPTTALHTSPIIKALHTCTNNQAPPHTHPNIKARHQHSYTPQGALLPQPKCSIPSPPQPPCFLQHPPSPARLAAQPPARGLAFCSRRYLNAKTLGCDFLFRLMSRKRLEGGGLRVEGESNYTQIFSLLIRDSFSSLLWLRLNLFLMRCGLSRSGR